jgi:prepilin signal peptidase PulO-like enzyme (type II secretory pathway)
MIGAFLGPTGVLLTVLLASVAGSIVGIGLIAIGGGDRKTRLPFGVFLSLGAIATLFFGAGLVRFYRSFWS